MSAEYQWYVGIIPINVVLKEKAISGNSFFGSLWYSIPKITINKDKTLFFPFFSDNKVENLSNGQSFEIFH